MKNKDNRQLFKPQVIYSYSQVLKILCPTQSSTASYILADMLADGQLERVINGYRINQ